MALSFDISADVRAAMATLDAAGRRQVPFAAARAVTQIAFEVQRDERGAMSQVFAHPRPFTQRSVMVDRARSAQPTAMVFVRHDVAKYLAPYEFGGHHEIPGKGLSIMEPVGLRLDAFGQIRGRPKNLGDRKNVFAGEIRFKKGGVVWGFWQRLKAKKDQPRVKLLVRAAEALGVEKHLGFVDRARATVAHDGGAIFGASLKKALASAK